MKMIVFQSRKTRLSAAARNALGVNVGSSIRIKGKGGDMIVEREVRRFRSEASKLATAVHNATGQWPIGLTSTDIVNLGLRPGDSIDVTDTRVAVVTTVAVGRKPASSPKVVGSASASEKPSTGKPESLASRLSKLRAGQRIVVTESAAKSSIYSAAKSAGVKVKKTGACEFERV